MNTIDEILASGRYTDRRGRDWGRIPGAAYWGRKVTQYLFAPNSEAWSDEDMRLLIERDMHRDECGGLGQCWNHPVAHVVIDRQLGLFDAFNPGSDVWGYDSLPEAMDAARALAVNP